MQNPEYPHEIGFTLLIKKQYVELCEGNHCAAALLWFFEYRHNLIVSAMSHKVWNFEDTISLYDQALQPCPMSLLEVAMMGLFKEKAIRTALTLLKSLDLITADKNPRATHLDNTLYVFFNAEILSDYLK